MAMSGVYKVEAKAKFCEFTKEITVDVYGEFFLSKNTLQSSLHGAAMQILIARIVHNVFYLFCSSTENDCIAKCSNSVSNCWGKYNCGESYHCWRYSYASGKPFKKW